MSPFVIPFLLHETKMVACAGPSGNREMKSVNVMTSVILLSIIVSWEILGPIETVTDVLLLLGIRWLQPVRMKRRSLTLLALTIAAAWVDWFVVDVWFSCCLLVGRHIGSVWLALSVLFGLRRKRPETSDPAPSTRGRIVLGSGFLIVSVGSLVAFAIARSEVRLIGASLAAVAHLLIIIRTLWTRWGRSALLYPVGMLLMVGFFCQLAGDAVYVSSLWMVQQRAYSRKVSSRQERRFPTSLLAAQFDFLRHRDAAFRIAAANGIRSMIYSEMLAAERGRGSGEWWNEPYWKGEWPAPVTAVALPKLIGLLNDDDFEVRMAALGNFRSAGPKAAPYVAALRQLLRDDGDVDNSQVGRRRDVLAQAALLGRLLALTGKKGSESDAGRAMKVRNVIAGIFVRIGPEARDAIPDLIPLLQDIAPPVRSSAADALGYMGPFAREAIPALEVAAQDKLFGDRGQIAPVTALWWIDQEHALVVPTYQEILNNGTSAAKKDAVGRVAAMGLRATDWSIPALIPLLDNRDLQDAVIESLCWVGVESPEAVEAVLRTLSPQLEAEATGRSVSVVLSYHFPRLIEFARGPGATAMAAGIRNIKSHYWSTVRIRMQNRLNACDPQVLAALQEMH
jgi:HEAT repeat protein